MELSGRGRSIAAASSVYEVAISISFSSRSHFQDEALVLVLYEGYDPSVDRVPEAWRASQKKIALLLDPVERSQLSEGQKLRLGSFGALAGTELQHFLFKQGVLASRQNFF